MDIKKFQHNTNFKNITIQNNQKKPELIDKLMNVVRNQDDINDCVAVPRGIFKAYLWIMSGFGLIGIGGALPSKFKKTKSVFTIAGNICNVISAFFFAKPFAFKGVSPNANMKELNRK